MTRLPLLLALLALPAAAQEQALDATVCRADHPTQCMCLTILTEGQDSRIERICYYGFDAECASIY